MASVITPPFVLVPWNPSLSGQGHHPTPPLPTRWPRPGPRRARVDTTSAVLAHPSADRPRGLSAKLKISLVGPNCLVFHWKIIKRQSCFQTLQPLWAGRDCRNYILQPLIIKSWRNFVHEDPGSGDYPLGKPVFGLIASNLVSFNSHYLGSLKFSYAYKWLYVFQIDTSLIYHIKNSKTFQRINKASCLCKLI